MQETSRFRTFSFSPLPLSLSLQLLLFLLSTVWLFPCHRFQNSNASFPPSCFLVPFWEKTSSASFPLLRTRKRERGCLEYFGASYSLQHLQNPPIVGVSFSLFLALKRSLAVRGIVFLALRAGTIVRRERYSGWLGDLGMSNKRDAASQKGELGSPAVELLAEV